ncbi:MAG: hypothetical protein ACRYG7_18335 [Janthinobacterium lividum]
MLVFHFPQAQVVAPLLNIGKAVPGAQLSFISAAAALDEAGAPGLALENQGVDNAQGLALPVKGFQVLKMGDILHRKDQVN